MSVVFHPAQIQRPVASGRGQTMPLRQHDQRVDVVSASPAARHLDITGSRTEQEFQFGPRQSRRIEIEVNVARQDHNGVIHVAVRRDEQATDDTLTVTEEAFCPSAALGRGVGHRVRQPVVAGAALLELEGERVTTAGSLHETPTSTRQ